MFLRVFGFVYELLQFKYCCGGALMVMVLVVALVLVGEGRVSLKVDTTGQTCDRHF